MDDDSPLVRSTRYLLRLTAAAERGLVTGIRLGLPPSMQIAIDDAIRRKDWGAKVKVGWDPIHVQPIGTPARRWASKREAPSSAK
ncbi:MAG: hypothetical protein ACREWE_08830 [Gammaproteobacteria bacterium]